MSALPDTAAVVADVLQEGLDEPQSIMSLAAKCVATDRKALADAGYEIVKRGSVPEWMEKIGCAGRDEVTPHELGHVSLYRLTTESGQS